MSADAFDSLIQLVQTRSLPPVHRWQPDRVGEIDIRIDRTGSWYHEGSRIKRQPLVDLFATILRRDADTYYLVTPHEKLKITVEEVPFVAMDFEASGHGDAQIIVFSTNVGDAVVLDASHPLTMRGARPYIDVRSGLEARVERSVFYRLVDLGAEQNGRWCVTSSGTRFDLGAVN